MKARLQDTAFTSYSAFDKDIDRKFDKEVESLCKFKNENNLVIQKVDRGNATVILEKTLIQLKNFRKIL